jgi:hypothetical protein
MRNSGAFETVPIKVQAVRLFVDGWYDICGKPKLCSAGSWLVQLQGGRPGENQLLCVPDDVFREGYRPTDTQSEAMWLERTNKIHPVWPTDDAKPIKLN